MISYRKAAALISPGDVVFALNDMGGITRHRVEKVMADSLKVDGGYLAFDLHGDLWWLTERGVPKELWQNGC